MFGDRKSSFSLKRIFCRSIVTRYILLDSVFGEGYSRHSSLTTDCPATVNVRRDTASRHQGFCAAVCRVGDVCPCNGSCGKLRVHKTWFLRNEPTVL